MPKKAWWLAGALFLTAMGVGSVSILHEVSADREVFGDVERRVLDNGLIALIKPSSKAHTVSLYLGVRCGSADEQDNLGSGLSHALEHMLFKGTPRRAPGQIEKEVQRMGGSSNAYTSHDMTVYYLQVLADHWENALDLLSDVAANAHLPEEEFNKEREVIRAEFRMNEDNLSRAADLALWELVFQNHPYGVPVIGYSTLFEKITRSDLLNFYKRHYVPNQMVLAVVGDVPLQSAEAAIRHTFGNLPRGPSGMPARPQEANQVSPRHRILYKESQHARLVIGFPGVAFSHLDAVTLDVLSMILGEGRSSRLNQELKESQKLVLEIDSFNATLKDHGLFGILAVGIPDRMEEARRAIQAEIEQLKREPVNFQELERVKNQALGSFYKSLETHASMSHQMLLGEIYAGDYRYAQRYPERVQKVRPEDIQRVLETYFHSWAYNEVLLLPQENERAGSATSIKADENSITRRVLPNGLRVLLGPDTVTPDVTIHWLGLGGLLAEEKETNGSCGLLSQWLLRGTSDQSQQEIAQTVEGWGGTLDQSSGQNSFSITITCLKAYLEEALELLESLVFDPAFSLDEFEKARELQQEAVRARSEDIFNSSVLALRKHLYAGHPYAMDPLGSEASLGGITPDAVKDFYERVLDPKQTVIALFGDFNPEEVWPRLERRFGSWDRKGKPISWPALPETLKGSRMLTEEVPREQAVALLAFSGISIQDPRRYAFQVLHSIMSGSAGRLYHRVRGEAGLAYVVDSSLVMGIHPGYFAFFASVEPSHAEEVLKMLVEEAQSLRAGGVTLEEMEAAKQELLGDYERMLESKTGKAVETSFSELYGLGLESFLNYRESILGVTREDVETVIREFVNPEHSLRLIVGPAERPLEKGTSS